MNIQQRKVAFRLSQLSYGGAERVFLSVAQYLKSQHGYQVDFVLDKVGEGGTEHIAIENGFNVVNLNATRTVFSILPLYRYLKIVKPDIIFTGYTDTNAAAILANLVNMNRTKLIVTEHASLKKHWASTSFVEKMLYKLKISYLYKLSNHVMCVSGGMLKELREMLSHPSMGYIHNPVRFGSSVNKVDKMAVRKKLMLDQDKKIILAVGRIAEAKNYLMLLKAFKDIKELSSTLLYIVGAIYSSEYKKRMDAFITQHGLADKVVFIDFTEDVGEYYQVADMFVLSSAWEGFGNVIVEAMAFGLPIVSTNCDFGPAEILDNGQYGTLVEVDDVSNMTKAIDATLSNESYDRSRLNRRSQDFSEAIIGEKYHQLINRVIYE